MLNFWGLFREFCIVKSEFLGCKFSILRQNFRYSSVNRFAIIGRILVEMLYDFFVQFSKKT